MVEPTLSVVTGTRNRPNELQRLVSSVLSYTSVDFEFIIADAGDIPLEPKDFPHSVVILPERPRMGMTPGYNRLFRAARGKWVIWLNDDAEVQPNYAKAAVDFMEANPVIGIGALTYREPPHRNDWHVNTCCYDLLYANFGIISRELGNQVGWFDEEIPMYGNDNSLAYRVLLAGRGIAAIHNARVVHYWEQDACRQANNNNREQDAYTLKRKYGPHLDEMRSVYRNTSLVSI